MCLSAQAPALPQLTVLSPADEEYVSGPTVLRAAVDPADAASAVVFFVDGRQVCVVTAAPFECEWDAGRSIAVHQIRVVATLVAGGRLVKTVRSKGLGYVENVDVDVVQVTVTVTDGHGKFVPGLPLSAFHVYEDGRPQKISHFSSENVPLELIVAVDISGSMAGSMPKLKTAVKEFLGAVPSGDLVTLLGFNDTFFTLTRRATTPADRIKAVDRLAPWGATALYDVIIRGVEMLGHQIGRKALVVFTDGEDQGSHATITDVERRLQASDVTLYMIGQGRGVTHDALQDDHGAPRDADRRPCALHREHRPAARRVQRAARRAVESVPARLPEGGPPARQRMAANQGGRRWPVGSARPDGLPMAAVSK